jgi:hypothetical protein
LPANIVLPPEIQRVIVVNNMAELSDQEEFHIYSFDADYKHFSMPLDSLSTVLCTSLWQTLEREDFFDGIALWRPLPGHDLQLPKDEKINEILRLTETDAVIALDYMHYNTRLNLGRDEDSIMLKAVYDVHCYALFTVYPADERLKKTSVTVDDTARWITYGFNIQSVINEMPYLDAALLDAINRTGEIAGNKLIPHWKTEYRKYYSAFSSDLKKAAQHIVSNDWESAFSIWTKLYEKKNSTLLTRAKCAANMALYYELNNRLDEAMEWAMQAEKEFQASGSHSDEAFYMDDYRFRLELRKKEMHLLDIQEKKY